jgi:hypothetical protein
LRLLKFSSKILLGAVLALFLVLGAGVTYRPRRKIGPQEKAVRKELRGLPADIAQGAVGQAMITLAQEADIGGLGARDLSQILREIRLSSEYLREISPAAGQGDEIDELRQRRENRLSEAQ